MAYINKFGLENFRVFKEQASFDLAPFTIFTGPNNSGKSSVSKALLLMKENAHIINEEFRSKATLNYHTGEHLLDNHKYVVNTKSKLTSFLFGINEHYFVSIEVDGKGILAEGYKIINEQKEIVIKQDGGNIYINTINFLEYLYDFYNREELKTEKFDTLKELIEALKTFSTKNHIIDVNLYDNSELNEENELDCSSLALAELFNNILKINLKEEEIQLLIPPTKEDFLQFGALTYVPNNRGQIKRAYSVNDKSFISSKIKELLSKDVSDTNKGKQLLNKYNSFTEKWVKKFNIGKKIEYGYNDNSDLFITLDGKSLLEYGFGVSQIINIFLALQMDLNKNLNSLKFIKETVDNELHFPKTFIIEEPETGLHPAFQSKMAEMIVDAHREFGINFIIETHSEYFIRKLQYLTAKGDITPEATAIYYFNHPDNIPKGEEQVKRITIDKYGGLSDAFGKGFYDEATNLKFDLLRLNKSQHN